METAFAAARCAFAFSALMRLSFTVARLAASVSPVMVKLRAVALPALSVLGGWRTLSCERAKLPATA